MKPTFMENDKIFVDKLSYRFHEPSRGDIIVFKYPLDRKKDYVKRLAGLPGDTIEIRKGVILVNGKPMTDPPFSKNIYYNVEEWDYGKSGQVIHVPEGHYFALGDNSAHSADSRQWGFVSRKDLIGKAFMIWWPPKRITLAR
jgi:signal peptidase I